MKRILLLLIILLAANTISFSQNRSIARGAAHAELYLSTHWHTIYYYGMPFDSCRHHAVCRVTENGKKLAIQYDIDIIAEQYNSPDSIMYPYAILADATPGVIYAKTYYVKGSYFHTSLWVSFDYGKNWMHKEENVGQRHYYPPNFDGTIYRTSSNAWDGAFRSDNYGTSFTLVSNISFNANESGFDICEFFFITGDAPYSFKLYHTYDLFQTNTVIPIDSQFMYGTMWISPDVYRGGLPGEVYISSMFYEESGKGTYKVSFSADTGHTFRHVYVSEILTPFSTFPVFMSDREPGVFYIIRCLTVYDTDPWGEHTKICIEYYRDYGETLVGTYCHDLHKNYGKTCEAVNDLAAEKCGNSCVLLTWSEPESSLPVEEYWVYRKAESKDKNYELRITNYEVIESGKQIIENRIEGEYELVGVTMGTTFLDEDLQVGEYEYYVVAHYEMGCVADSSNHVTEIISVEEPCVPVNDLVSEKLDANTVLLIWSEPESNLQVEGYSVFRNSLLQNSVLLTDTVFLDENLPNGSYEYYVVAHYENGCVADSSNHVIIEIEVGIKEKGDGRKEIVLFPNPTTGELRIEVAGQARNDVLSVEVFDVYGRKVGGKFPSNVLEGWQPQADGVVIDLTVLHPGIYFVRVSFDGGISVKKLVKQ